MARTRKTFRRGNVVQRLGWGEPRPNIAYDTQESNSSESSDEESGKPSSSSGSCEEVQGIPGTIAILDEASEDEDRNQLEEDKNDEEQVV